MNCCVIAVARCWYCALVSRALDPHAATAMDRHTPIIKAMVASGLGIALIPYSAVAKDVRAGRFAFTRVRGRRLYRETGWVYLKSDYVPRTITEVLRIFDLMKAHFGIRPPGA